MLDHNGAAIVAGLMLIPVAIGIGVAAAAIKLSDVSREKWESLLEDRRNKRKSRVERKKTHQVSETPDHIGLISPEKKLGGDRESASHQV